jgi:hypothetical protein
MTHLWLLAVLPGLLVCAAGYTFTRTWDHMLEIVAGSILIWCAVLVSAIEGFVWLVVTYG